MDLIFRNSSHNINKKLSKKNLKNLNFLDSYGEKEIFSMSGNMSSIDKPHTKYEKILHDESNLSSEMSKKGNYKKSNSKKYTNHSGNASSRVKLTS